MLNFILDIIFLLLSILDLIYRIIDRKGKAFYELPTYLVIMAIIYYLDQILKLSKYYKADSNSKERTLTTSTSEFIRDHLYKFLLSLVVGVLFIFELTDLMHSGFDKYDFPKDTKTFKKFLTWMDGIYTGLALPLELILDAFLTSRIRVPNFRTDIVILIAIVILFCVIKILFWHKITDFKGIFKEIGNCFMTCIFTFDGYIFTDYLVYKTNYNTGNYALFSTY